VTPETSSFEQTLGGVHRDVVTLMRVRSAATLQLMQAAAAPALALLQRATNGDQSAPQ
jgi:hypothetical protein